MSGRPGRLVLLVTSPRVAPGLLSWAGWDALRTADRVVAADVTHPLLAPVTDALGRPPDVLEAGSPEALARALLAAAAEQVVVFLVGTDGSPGLGEALGAAVLDQPPSGPDVAGGGAARPEVEVLPASYDVAGARLLDLVAVMDRLRSPGGCPWDAEQTHESLVPYLLEEAYETLEAIESGDRAHLREELGDLLLQVVFHARVAEEDGDDPWSVDDVAGDIVDKLVRRHPHVFGAVGGDGDGGGRTAADVEASWETLKSAEKSRTSAMDGVPLAQPALALAAKLLDRAERSGLAVRPSDDDDLGERLLRLVAAARASGVDAEAALRRAARHYAERVRAAEAVAAEAAARGR